MSFIGIDLGGTSVKGGLVGPEHILHKETALLNRQGTADEIFEQVCRLIASLWEHGVKGIGFAVPALINFSSGVIYDLNNIPKLDDFPLREKLFGRFGVPVLLQNDANCFVLGEKYFGSAKEYKDVVGLITGTGVGAGLFLNNKLYSGVNCGAGEFGMIPYKDKNFESYCSGRFFSENYSIPGEELAVLATDGDVRAQEAFDRYGRHLAELLNLICYALDPGMIVIGGSVSRSFHLYEHAMRKAMESYCFTPEKKVQIMPSEMQDVAIYGAAGLFFEEQISR
jgi:glucokinase